MSVQQITNRTENDLDTQGLDVVPSTAAIIPEISYKPPLGRVLTTEALMSTPATPEVETIKNRRLPLLNNKKKKGRRRIARDRRRTNRALRTPPSERGLPRARRPCCGKEYKARVSFDLIPHRSDEARQIYISRNGNLDKRKEMDYPSRPSYRITPSAPPSSTTLATTAKLRAQGSTNQVQQGRYKPEGGKCFDPPSSRPFISSQLAF